MKHMGIVLRITADVKMVTSFKILFLHFAYSVVEDKGKSIDEA